MQIAAGEGYKFVLKCVRFTRKFVVNYTITLKNSFKVQKCFGDAEALVKVKIVLIYFYL